MSLCRLSFLSYLLVLSSIASSQDSIYFSYPIYFEDAIGNRDTVFAALVEGYPDEQERPLIQLGEEKIDVPFDSVFEVRMYWDEAQVNEEDHYFTQTLVLGSEGDPGKGISLPYKAFIHAKYPPVTVSYSVNELEEHGLVGSYFTRDEIQFSLPNPQYLDDFRCAVEEGGSFQVNLNDSAPQLYSPLRESFAVEGSNGLTSMPGIMFHFGNAQDCQYVSAAAVAFRQKLFIYPTITNDRLNFRLPGTSFPAKCDVRISSVDGRVLDQEMVFTRDNQNLSVSHLTPGQYYLIIQTKKMDFIGRFVKM